MCGIFLTISLECDDDGDPRLQEKEGGIMVRKRVHFFGTFSLNSKEIPVKHQPNWNLKIKQKEVWEFVTQTRRGQM